jgi:excisionase family DNA binding protein
MPRTPRTSQAVMAPGRLFATAPEAAKVLRADARTVRAALEAGRIPGTKVGGIGVSRSPGCGSKPRRAPAAQAAKTPLPRNPVSIRAHITGPPP